MGVYIKGMEKPKRCEECRFRTCFIKVNLKKYTCWLNGEECGKTDCPLIEIDDDVWENEKYKLIRMTEERRVNKKLAERRANEGANE